MYICIYQNGKNKLNQHTMKPIRTVYLERWEGSESVKYWYWLVDAKTGEPIDGDRRRYVAVEMAQRWGLKIIPKK